VEKDLYNMSEVAGIISKEQGRKVGRNTIFKKLRAAGCLNKQNEPCSGYHDCFETQRVERAYGFSTKMTLVRPKGVDLIRKLMA